MIFNLTQDVIMTFSTASMKEGGRGSLEKNHLQRLQKIGSYLLNIFAFSIILLDSPSL
jgi:hypothetical protein